jgi:hypothetical protein
MFVLTAVVVASLQQANAQDANVLRGDSLHVEPLLDSTQTQQLQRESFSVKIDSTTFKPNPKRAALYAALLPGWGQIYNGKFWKLPLVFGGYMGFIYAITWNNKNYQDYSNAYFDIVKDDPENSDSWHESWINFVPAGRDPASYLTDTNFHSRLKSGRDFYRRYRDLSIILTVGWYLICMADAYVDAQLFDFDISPDLSLHVAPVVNPATRYTSSLYGINCSINF